MFVYSLLLSFSPDAYPYTSSSVYGPGMGPIFLNSLNCRGSESTLLECSGSSPFYCAHSGDAGVQCKHKVFSGEFCAVYSLWCTNKFLKNAKVKFVVLALAILTLYQR